MHNQNDQETLRRLKQLENLVEKHTRTERHLEQYTNISSKEKITHAKNLQQKREQEMDHLEQIISSDIHSNNNELENVNKNFQYTDGYLHHNQDHIDANTLDKTKEKQEHRKEQMEFLE